MLVLFGVLLSGMGVYAATQLGVLCALEDHGLAPDVLAGIGAGAWIAGVFACRASAKETVTVMRDICKQGKKLLDFDWRRMMFPGNGDQLRGLLRGDRLQLLLEEQTMHRMLGELQQVRLAIPTTALPTRKTLVFSNHAPAEGSEGVWTQQASIALAIRAALATPALMRPALWMGVPLVGTAGMSKAASALKQMCARHALVVDTYAQRPHGRLGLWDIVGLGGITPEEPDYPAGWQVIAPKLPDYLHAMSIEALDVAIEIGYGAAMEAMPCIKAATGEAQGKVLPFQNKR